MAITKERKEKRKPSWESKEKNETSPGSTAGIKFIKRSKREMTAGEEEEEDVKEKINLDKWKAEENKNKHKGEEEDRNFFEKKNGEPIGFNGNALFHYTCRKPKFPDMKYPNTEITVALIDPLKLGRLGVALRKEESVDSISVCTASTRPVGRSERSDTPSSILSSDSDIRFTRKLGSHYRCGCCIVAGFLFFLLVAAISVYVAYTFILSQSVDERIFRVNFKVTDGDSYEPKLADPSTEDFRIRARNYRERLNLIFKRSFLRPAFIKTDILALDGNEGQDLVVHFNAHFDARRMPITTTDVEAILSKEINLENSLYLSNLTIPIDSLVIRESIADMTTNVPLNTAATASFPTTTRRPPRQCSPLQLNYCLKMSYNTTSYPNIVGHSSYSEVLDDVISFREVVDAECYRLAYEFVCLILQPPCQKAITESEDLLLMPCKNYCNDFMKNCGGRIPPRLKAAFDCSKFPELTSSGNCISKPGCVEELQSRGLESRLCDGVIDCEDISDELFCNYCQSDYIHCGVGRLCIPREKKCDGSYDCPNGSDEKNCLSVLPSTSSFRNAIATPHQRRYFDTGFVTYNHKGQIHKLCMDNYNTSDVEDQFSMQQLTDSLCRSASYQKAVSYTVEKDEETEYLPYVQMIDKSLFVQTECSQKNILQLGCDNLKCGIQPLHSQPGVQGLNKMANHGDWPWHVALLKDSIHLCDATLLSEDWLLTTASCFQGQSKAEWIARFGSVRLTSSSPWEQERQIVGMVKSPVEGSTLVLLKLNAPVIYSDFLRPVCLPETFTETENFTYCNTLGWNKNKEQLQRIDVKISQMALCENISITTVNSVCAESLFSTRDCNEEEFAGSPLLCLTSDEKQWRLIGVSNWRIACQKAGTERPRLYDKTLTNMEWINQTIFVS